MNIEVTGCESAGKGKLRVRFDNGITCQLYRGEARRFQIAEGESISEEQYEELITEVLGKRAKKRALHLLEQMDRTRQGLRDKLRTSGYPECCIDDAIAYVSQYHYLDDERYASNFVRCSQEKMSRSQIRQKLVQRGIDRELAERVLEEEYSGDEYAQIMELLRKRRYDPEICDSKEFGRTYAFLMRRGFAGSMVRRCMLAEGDFLGKR